MRLLSRFFRLFLLFSLFARRFLRLQTLFLYLLQTLLLGGLLFTHLLRLLLRLFFTLLFRAFGARLLVLLAVVVFHYRAGIDHYGVDRRAATAARRRFNMLIERTPDQQRHQNYVQHG
ncbi:hypothetical protein EDP2_3809 [Enterobacter cloacae S611]|uniref:Secreted peptide n=1 Tax=Enterobacter cloacae S611 TaxID=1399146 RepID=A0ABN0QCX2_ENTCL|nr:hypothetical protein EDP2_3809 [Enterobacter cloacae S611]